MPTAGTRPATPCGGDEELALVVEEYHRCLAGEGLNMNMRALLDPFSIKSNRRCRRWRWPAEQADRHRQAASRHSETA